MLKKFLLTLLILSLAITPVFASTTERRLLTAATSTGASGVRDVSNYNLKTIYILATGVTTGATIEVETSFDGTTFVSVSTTVVVANGLTEVAISNLLQKLIRVNITSFTDGTYTIDLIAKG